jgi:hypothetical protein
MMMMMMMMILSKHLTYLMPFFDNSIQMQRRVYAGLKKVGQVKFIVFHHFDTLRWLNLTGCARPPGHQATRPPGHQATRPPGHQNQAKAAQHLNFHPTFFISISTISNNVPTLQHLYDYKHLFELYTLVLSSPIFIWN